MNKKEHASRNQELSNAIISALIGRNLEVTPINFELMYEIISGNNPELRTKFTALGRYPDKADVMELAQQYLPHHFGNSIYEHSAASIQSELGGLEQSLSMGQGSLQEYADAVSRAETRLKRMDPKDTNSIQNELKTIHQATVHQKLKNQEIISSVEKQIESVRALNSEMSDFELAKFINQSTGMGNRRAFNKRMAELYKDKDSQNYSLVYGNIPKFEFLDKIENLKVKEAFLQRFGAFSNAQINQAEASFWLGSPQFCFLFNSSDENEINLILKRINDQISSIFESLTKAIAPGRSAVAVFGCASSYDASHIAELISNAEHALEASLSAPERFVVWFRPNEKGKLAGRGYKIYARDVL